LRVTECLDQIAAAAAEEVVLFHAGRRPLPQAGPDLMELREALVAHNETLTAEPLRGALDDVCNAIRRTRAWTDSPSGTGMGNPRVGAKVERELSRLQDLVTVAKRELSRNDGNGSSSGGD